MALNKKLKVKIAQSLYKHDKFAKEHNSKVRAAKDRYDMLDSRYNAIYQSIIDVARSEANDSDDYVTIVDKLLAERRTELDTLYAEMDRLVAEFGHWESEIIDGELAPKLVWDGVGDYDWEESDYRDLDISDKDWIEIQGHIAALKQQETELNSTGVSSNYDYEI